MAESTSPSGSGSALEVDPVEAPAVEALAVGADPCPSPEQPIRKPTTNTPNRPREVTGRSAFAPRTRVRYPKAVRAKATLFTNGSLRAAVFATLLAACGPSPSTPSPPPGHPLVPMSAEPPVESAPLPSASATAAAVRPPRVETVPELARFYAALRGLEEKTRKTHVRVFWMGDSHAAADFWSGALRDGLQSRFGNAGPGFLHLGYKDYRHDGVKITIDGKWRMRPKKPAGVKTDGDGLVGLGGILMGGYRDVPRAHVAVTSSLKAESLTYDFCYRLKKHDDTIDVDAGGQRSTLRATEAEPAGSLRHALLKGALPGEFTARPTNGTPDFCGVAIETDPAEAPGVVLDTLGINGARYKTALSWDEKGWEAEVSRRPPDLVVLEYGTNEAGDGSPAYTQTGEGVDALLKRIRAVAPETDCVVVSATDRADAEEHLPPMNASLAEAAKRGGCFFFDAYTVLGGKGSTSKMRDEAEPRAQKDGIHLTIRGYRELGRKMFDALMKGY